MPSTEQIVLKALRKTCFLATNIEDISGVLRLGEIEHAIVARKSYWYSLQHGCPVHIDELHTGKRKASISDLVILRSDLIQKALDQTSYIWTFRPHTWTDDLSLLGKKPLCWDFYPYTYWSNKHHQDRLLLEHAPPLLEEHLREKHVRLHRKYMWSSEIESLANQWVISCRESIAGQGVFVSSEGLHIPKANLDVLYRVERKIWPHIPVCQIAATAGGQSVCFKPSVMILKEHEGHLDYLGSDFNVVSYLSEEVIGKITALTKSVGTVLGRVGFKGTYNCDYIYSPETDELYFAEVNPRNSGCQFILDDKFALDRVHGSAEALFFMPIVINLHAHIFSRLPDALAPYFPDNRYIEFSFTTGQASSFAHLNAVNAGLAEGVSRDAMDEEGEIWAIKTSETPMILEPYVPTLLVEEGEMLY